MDTYQFLSIFFWNVLANVDFPTKYFVAFEDLEYNLSMCDSKMLNYSG